MCLVYNQVLEDTAIIQVMSSHLKTRGSRCLFYQSHVIAFCSGAIRLSVLLPNLEMSCHDFNKIIPYIQLDLILGWPIIKPYCVQCNE